MVESKIISELELNQYSKYNQFHATAKLSQASTSKLNRLKSLNEDLERLGRQQEELASKHKLTEMKFPPADQLIVKTWNMLPVTYQGRPFSVVYTDFSKCHK